MNSAGYGDFFGAMINDWLNRWEIGNFPFYFVQLAPYDYPDGRDNSALVREAQAQIQDRLFNTSMAVILDIGEENDIHPRTKIPVGEMLDVIDLWNTYQVKASPTFDSMTIERRCVRLLFKHSSNGLSFEWK